MSLFDIRDGVEIYLPLKTIIYNKIQYILNKNMNDKHSRKLL